MPLYPFFYIIIFSFLFNVLFKFFPTCPYLYICNSCIFVYVCVCVCVCVYVCVYMYMCMYVCVYVCIVVNFFLVEAETRRRWDIFQAEVTLY